MRACWLLLVLLFPATAHAHLYYLSRTVVVQAREDGSVGALVVFEVPKGTTASLIRAGLDDDWSRTLSVRERSSGVRRWAETGMRDIDFFVAGDLAECTYDTTSTLQERLPDDSAFSVAVLVECQPLVERSFYVWQVYVGARIKTRVSVLHPPALIAGDLSGIEVKQLRAIDLGIEPR